MRRLYSSIIDLSSVTDGRSSIHRQRLSQLPLTLSEYDLEACAHHIFDGAIAAHTRGWNRPLVYHKKVVRGKLVDGTSKSLEARLHHLCRCLRHHKATVDDALRGGITLALLCDNPEARSFTKASNNNGNKIRGEKLKLVKDWPKGDAGEEGAGAGAGAEQPVEEDDDDDDDDYGDGGEMSDE